MDSPWAPVATSEGEYDSSVNLSSLTKLAILDSSCSRKVVWINEGTTGEFNMRAFSSLFTSDCTIDHFKKWWESLFSRNIYVLENTPLWIQPLVQHMHGLSLTGAAWFKNGAGKMTASFLLGLAGLLPPRIIWTTRISTTNDPRYDWCGFLGVQSSSTPEKHLNGVVDGLIVSGNWILGVLEVKHGAHSGLFQLLGGCIKIWSITNVYPIGVIFNDTQIQVYYPNHISRLQHRYKFQTFNSYNAKEMLRAVHLIKVKANLVYTQYNSIQLAEKLAAVGIPTDADDENNISEEQLLIDQLEQLRINVDSQLRSIKETQPALD